MNTKDERNADPIKEMAQVVRSLLDLAPGKFRESYSSSKSGILIYESEWCRIKLVWGGWDYRNGNSVHIFYGRLHAPNEASTMLWRDEECYCWHELDYVLHFLDDSTPLDTVNLNYSHPITDPFYEAEFRKKFSHLQPEWLSQMHMAIWQHYGTKLFELFDLRQPALWQQYRQFLREVYDIEGRIPEIQPPMDNVC